MAEESQLLPPKGRGLLALTIKMFIKMKEDKLTLDDCLKLKTENVFCFLSGVIDTME